MTQEAILLRGLPASGKTTWAKERLQALNAQGHHYVHICRDDIRDALHFGEWKPRYEGAVIAARDALIRSALGRGDSIIVDETFTNWHQFVHVRDLIRVINPEVEVSEVYIPTPLQECIKRDLKRGARAVGPSVIREHARKLADHQELQDGFNAFPPAIICDIDGTIALKRPEFSPYDPAHYASDIPNAPVIQTVLALHTTVPDCNLIIVSGRDEAHYDVTYDWITGNTPLWPGELLMRPRGSRDKDYVVKRALYDKHIRGKYRVIAVFDDRDQTVDEWRQLGLPTFQVADGGF